PARGQGHADAGSQALAERPRRGFHAAGPAVLGVARALAVELAELLEVVKLDRRLAELLVLRVNGLDPGQVQQRIQQRRTMPGGEHEAIAVAPNGLVRIEA